MMATDPSSQLSELAERFWRFQCYEFPLIAILAGEETVDAVTFREAPEDYERRHRVAQSMLRELCMIEPNQLSSQDKATRTLLRRELEEICRLHDVLAHTRPMMFPFGPAFQAMNLPNLISLHDEQSADLYNERLKTLPAFIRDAEQTLQLGYEHGIRYPRAVLDAAVLNLRANISVPVEKLPWLLPYARASELARSLAAKRDEAATIVRDAVVPSFQAHADFLQTVLAKNARTSVACTDAPLGEEFYRAMIQHYTTSDLTPAQIHELGVVEVERLTAEMRSITAQAGFSGDLVAYRRSLQADPELIANSADSLREEMEGLCKRIDKCIPKFFGHLPRITYGVESVPEPLADRMPAAYALPGPGDFTAPGIFWVSSLPKKCPRYLHIPLALHEAWPGHLMHLALMQERMELPAFRRNGITNYSACIEGWGMYCERLGLDMGLYETHTQRYGAVEMEMFRAIRLVVDTGIHCNAWTREEAIEYMEQHLLLPRITIESEVDRYIAVPAQALAYQVGNLKFRELRSRAERQLADRFSLRAFHDTLMAAGAVTLAVLEDFVNEWLEKTLQ